MTGASSAPHLHMYRHLPNPFANLINESLPEISHANRIQ
jgi:hypothetical protein